MFYAAAAFNQDISGWQVGAVTHTGRMFMGAVSFNQDINDWKVSPGIKLGEYCHTMNEFGRTIRLSANQMMFFGALSFQCGIDQARSSQRQVPRWCTRQVPRWCTDEYWHDIHELQLQNTLQDTPVSCDNMV